MKIFAVRDRMLDYFQRPWLFEQASDFVAAVAAAINAGDRLDGKTADYVHTPEHFEIWQLGEIDTNTGAVTPALTIIHNCASLIRPGIRSAGAEGDGRPAVTAGIRGGTPGRAQGPQGPRPGAVQDQAHAAHLAPGAPRAQPGGGNQGPEGGVGH